MTTLQKWIGPSNLDEAIREWQKYKMEVNFKSLIPNDNKWHHFVTTQDGADIKHYLDGKEIK